jgi:Protein of unknown function (DUF1257)
MTFGFLRTNIKDAEILKAALKDLGIQSKTEADVRGYLGQRVRADVVAVLEGQYDIGWSKNTEGTFELVAYLDGLDEKHNSIELINSVNQRYKILKTLLEVERSKSEAKRPEWMVLDIDLSKETPTDAVALEIAQLCKAINAYHIACGGTGLVIDEWELLVLARQLVGV